jgi:hypothetical protein
MCPRDSSHTLLLEKIQYPARLPFAAAVKRREIRGLEEVFFSAAYSFLRILFEWSIVRWAFGFHRGMPTAALWPGYGVGHGQEVAAFYGRCRSQQICSS